MIKHIVYKGLAGNENTQILDYSRIYVMSTSETGAWKTQGTYPVYSSLSDAIDDIEDGGEIWLNSETWTFATTDKITPSKSITFRGGFTGNELFSDQADPTTNITTIDADTNAIFYQTSSGAYNLTCTGIHFDGFYNVLDITGTYSGNVNFTNCHIKNGNGSQIIVRLDSGSERTDGYYFYNCQFYDNSDSTAPVFATYRVFIDCKYSIIYNNTTTLNGSFNGAIAYVQVSSSKVTFTNCLIYGNECTDTNGGSVAFANDGGTVHFINSTIDDNGSSDSEFTNGGIAANIILHNTIFTSNHSGTHFGSSCSVTANNSRLPNLTEIDTDNGGNIDDDPQYTDDTSRDYTLLYSSPCIEAGDNSLISENFDLAGNARKLCYGTNAGLNLNGSDNYGHLNNSETFEIGDSIKLAIDFTNISTTSYFIATDSPGFYGIRYNGNDFLIYIGAAGYSSLSWTKENRVVYFEIKRNTSTEYEIFIDGSSIGTLSPNTSDTLSYYMLGYRNGLYYFNGDIKYFETKGVKFKFNQTTGSVVNSSIGSNYLTLYGTKSGNISGTYFDAPIVDMGCYEI